MIAIIRFLPLAQLNPVGRIVRDWAVNYISFFTLRAFEIANDQSGFNIETIEESGRIYLSIRVLNK